MESGSIAGVEYGRVDARDRSRVLWLGVLIAAATERAEWVPYPGSRFIKVR